MLFGFTERYTKPYYFCIGFQHCNLLGLRDRVVAHYLCCLFGFLLKPLKIYQKREIPYYSSGYPSVAYLVPARYQDNPRTKCITFYVMHQPS